MDDANSRHQTIPNDLPFVYSRVAPGVHWHHRNIYKVFSPQLNRVEVCNETQSNVSLATSHQKTNPKHLHNKMLKLIIVLYVWSAKPRQISRLVSCRRNKTENFRLGSQDIRKVAVTKRCISEMTWPVAKETRTGAQETEALHSCKWSHVAPTSTCTRSVRLSAGKQYFLSVLYRGTEVVRTALEHLLASSIADTFRAPQVRFSSALHVHRKPRLEEELVQLLCFLCSLDLAPKDRRQICLLPLGLQQHHWNRERTKGLHEAVHSGTWGGQVAPNLMHCIVCASAWSNYVPFLHSAVEPG